MQLDSDIVGCGCSRISVGLSSLHHLALLSTTCFFFYRESLLVSDGHWESHSHNLPSLQIPREEKTFPFFLDKKVVGRIWIGLVKVRCLHMNQSPALLELSQTRKEPVLFPGTREEAVSHLAVFQKKSLLFLQNERG